MSAVYSTEQEELRELYHQQKGDEIDAEEEMPTEFQAVLGAIAEWDDSGSYELRLGDADHLARLILAALKRREFGLPTSEL